MNSVREISEEVERLLVISNGLERVDVFYSVKELIQVRDAMQQEFSKDVYDELKVASKKKLCERAAIQLEYLLMKFDINLKRRYASRVVIANLYVLLSDNIAKEKKSGFTNKESLAQVLCNYAQVERLVNESQSLLFSLTKEDKELLELIQNQMDEYGEVSSHVES